MIDKNFVADEGGRIQLRPLLESDVNDEYLDWFRDSVVTEFLDAREITKRDAIDYIRNGTDSNAYHMFAVIHKGDGRHIGNLKIGPIQWNHLVSDLVTVIGRREYWGSGYATEAISLGNKVAFNEYGIRKLSGGIADGNIGSIKAYTRAGWVIEARMIGHHLINGEPRDRIVVSCFNPKFFPSEICNPTLRS